MTKKQMKFYKYLGNITSVIFCVLLPLGFMYLFITIPKLEIDDFGKYFTEGIIIPLLIYYLSYILSIFIHELGHLVMGLKNKFKFIEFDVFMLSLYKKDKKLKIKYKGSIKGIVGFCSMDIPKEAQKKELQEYFLGGILGNIFLFCLSLISIILIMLIKNNISLLTLFVIYNVLINFGLILVNYIPKETMSGLDNDGLVVYRLNHEQDYIDSLKSKQEIAKLLEKGASVIDIPDDLTIKPKKLETSSDFFFMNLYTAKLIHNKEYEEAEKEIKKSIENENCSLNNKYTLKINLIDIYIYTKRFNEIKEIVDKGMLKFITALSRLQEQMKIYLYTYYLVNDIKLLIPKVENDLDKYLNKCDLNIYANKEVKELYSLLKDNYKED